MNLLGLGLKYEAPTGILAFGSSHPSVIGQASMLTEASITSFGAGSLLEAGATVDPVLGVIAGGSGAVMFTGFTAAQLAALDVAGQMSFTIQTKAISENFASTGSVGATFVNNAYVVTHSVTHGGGAFGRTWIDSGNAGNTEADSLDTHVVWNSHSLGNPEYSVITLSWTYNSVKIYINGRFHGESVRTNHTANIFTFIYLLSERGNALPVTLSGYYVKHFIIATQPVTLRSHPLLENVRYFGDSFVSQATLSGAAGLYRNNAQYAIEAYFATRGYLINLTIDGHSGATLADAGGVNLQSFRAAAVASNPTLVIIQAGVNDAVAGYSAGTITTDAMDHINTFLAGTCEYIVIGNTPTLKANSTYDSPTYVSRVATINSAMNALEATWNVANPGDLGRVRGYDLFTEYGGETPIDDVFAGQIAATLGTDFHPSAKGQLMKGNLIAATIWNIMTNTYIGS